MVFLLILNLGKSRFSTNHAFEIGIFDGCNGEEMWKFTSLILFWSTRRQHLTRLVFAIYLQVFKAHQQISKKQYFEKYIYIVHMIKYANIQLYRVYTPWRSYLENLTIDNKFIKKGVSLFMHQMMCQEEKILKCHNKVAK